MQLIHVLKKPVITEKSAIAQGSAKYTFLVNSDATKIDVAKAVHMAYGVDVAAVNIIPVAKKQRLVGRGKVITKRPQSKKAIVTLKSKQSIDFNKLKVSK